MEIVGNVRQRKSMVLGGAIVESVSGDDQGWLHLVQLLARPPVEISMAGVAGQTSNRWFLRRTAARV